MIPWRQIIGTRRDWTRDLALSTAVAVFFSVIGPFGSWDQPWHERLVYCLGVGWAGALVFYPGLRLGLHFTNRAGWPLWPAAAGLAAVLCAPVAVMVNLVRIWLPGGPAEAPPFPLAVGQVALVILPLTLAALGVHRWLMPRAEAMPAAEAPAPRPELLARLPARLGGEVLALEAQDHYVRVHTAQGSTLLLMRFADAVAEMAPAEGLRVHRSWWVAKAAVRDRVPRGRRMDLVLEGGLIAPVTREAAALVRRANWV